MILYPKTDRKKRRFSLNSFRFVGSEFHSVYLFCHVAVCSEKEEDTKQCHETRCTDEENLLKEVKLPTLFKNSTKTQGKKCFVFFLFFITYFQL